MKRLLYFLSFLGLVATHKSQVNEITFKKVDDIALHVYAGTAVNIGISTAIYKKTKRTGLACATGFLSAILIGGAKEMLYDKTLRFGTPSSKDFFATCWGASVAFPIVRSGIDIHERKQLNKAYFEFLADSLRQTHLNTGDTPIN